MWVIGENYFGQRGTGDCITNESNFRKVEGLKISAGEGSDEKERL